MRIDKITLEPLPSKHYSTSISLLVGGNGWDEVGKPFHIEICGVGSGPSTREYESGYFPDYGMDHVESEEHYKLAVLICEALRKASK